MGKNVLKSLERRPLSNQSVLFPRSAVPMHAMLTGAGRELQHHCDYDWHGLKRGDGAFALLQHTFAGRGQVELEGKTHFVLPGQTMLLFTPHDNRYRLVDDDPWDFFWVGMTGAELMRMWRSAVTRLGPVVTLPPMLQQQAAQVCTAILDQELEGVGHASSLAYGLAARLCDEAYPLFESHKTRPIEVQRAIDYLRAHLQEAVTVEQLAEVAGYSKWHFARVFMRSEGLAPSEFIARQRMKEAAAMLQKSNEPIKTIAFRCGFEDPNYFAKVFRRTFHVSPSVFRDHRMFRGA